jgi:hypothetical protein
MKVSGRLQPPDKGAPFSFIQLASADLDAMKKRKISCFCRDWNPYSSAIQPVSYPLYRMNDNSFNNEVHRSRRCRGAILSSSFPSNFISWVILPGVYASANMILRAIKARTPPTTL